MDISENDIIDISLTLKEGMITYPNNPEFKINQIEGEHSYISTMQIGTHTGTHVDVPAHEKNCGEMTVHEIPLSKLLGRCRVIDVSSSKEFVSIKDLSEKNIQEGERILLKTANSLRGFDSFYKDYVYLGGDCADYLAEKKVGLVGIDSLSIKKGDDRRGHSSLLSKNILIIEGLDLKDVQEEEYFLIALPLKIYKGDGAPMRVVLIKQKLLL